MIFSENLIFLNKWKRDVIFIFVSSIVRYIIYGLVLLVWFRGKSRYVLLIGTVLG